MTTTHGIAPGGPRRTRARVVATGSALAFGCALFLTVASIDVPHHASDAELLRWWQDAGHRSAGVISGFAAIAVAITFPVVTNYVTQLPGSDRSWHWQSFARSMTAAVTALWLVTGAVRATVGHVVGVSGEPLPRVDSLRLVTAVNYALLGLSGMAVLGLAILALSIVILSAGVLPGWIGYVGAACSGVVLLAVGAQYGAYTTAIAVLWAFCLAVAVWRQRGPASTQPPRTPRTGTAPSARLSEGVTL